ncbi:MAG: tRNA adenosine(34) deaminase TadA [Firmicutes bacterium]|nr:tRNA adenosine(34) deaminase TadA [Bacillota bacterium]MCL1944937.1 tRNA adenosine(34) deaminase TadA [Bacillota bacterium]MCL1954267.1 tRNA adenosine(34) deaminase TadA [Bacillota bacterium]
MKQSIHVARNSDDCEVPVGVVIVRENEVLVSACNERESNFDPTGHAEIVALRKAGAILNRWNLSDCDLYVTLEPCTMCAGAIVNARIRKVVFGAYDARYGAMQSAYSIGTDGKLNHRVQVQGGILSDECGLLLTEFFKKIRRK